MKGFVLNNELPVPAIGFGTWQIPDGKPVVDAMIAVLTNSSRHIDKAAAYKMKNGRDWI